MYIIECCDGSLFAEITTNVSAVILRHNSPVGHSYTAPKKKRPVRVILSWKFFKKKDALAKRDNFRKMNRRKKLFYISRVLLSRLG
jgi:putative endonuclease